MKRLKKIILSLQVTLFIGIAYTLAGDIDYGVLSPDQQRLLHVIWHGTADEVRTMLDAGVPVDAVDGHGRTILSHAFWAGQRDERITLLVAQRSSQLNEPFTDKNATFCYPIQYASSEGLIQVVTLMLSRDVDVNVSNRFKVTPLHNATSRGHLNIAKALLDHGADVNAQDKNGQTPLHQAVWFLKVSLNPLVEPDKMTSDVNLVRLLVESGADPTSEDAQGHTALDLAVMHNAHDVAQYLQQKLKKKQRTN